MRLYPLLLALIAVQLAPCPADAAASRIRWRNNLQAASLEARNTAKPMLVRFSASWCRYCKKMQRETFANDSVIGHVEDCFVPVTVDGDAHRQLARQMGVRSYPTTIILSPKMKVLARITGFRTADELSVDLTKICVHDRSEDQHRERPLHQGPRESVFGTLCPVSPIVDETFAHGDPATATTYRGFRVTFQTGSHRAEFLRNPERYWPVADGRCVVTALDRGEARFGTLDYGLMFRGRVWLFASESHRDRFRKMPSEYFDKLVTLTEGNATSTRELGSTGLARTQIRDAIQRDAR